MYNLYETDPVLLHGPTVELGLESAHQHRARALHEQVDDDADPVDVVHGHDQDGSLLGQVDAQLRPANVVVITGKGNVTKTVILLT